MSSEDSRLRIVAMGAVALAVLVAALYGLARHIPLLTRPVSQVRASAGNMAPAGRYEPGHATISGVVTRADGTPQPATVALIRTPDSLRPAPQGRGRFGGSGRGANPLSTSAGADGHFALNNIPAGTFWLVAHAEVVAEPPALPMHLWGVQDVTSNGQSISEPTLTLEPGGTITGLLEFASAAGTARPDVSTTTITLTPADARTQAQLISGIPRARPDDSGAFVITAIAPGRYTLEVSAFTDWSLDSALVDGQGWIDRPFDVAAGWGTRRATLVFSDRPNVVTGVIRKASGQPAGFTLVMAFSSDPALRQSPRRVQATRSDAAGRFTLSGLPTGAYLVAPAADLPPDRWYTPGSFVELTPRAAPVSLGHGESKTVSLQIR